MCALTYLPSSFINIFLPRFTLSFMGNFLIVRLVICAKILKDFFHLVRFLGIYYSLLEESKGFATSYLYKQYV